MVPESGEKLVTFRTAARAFFVTVVLVSVALVGFGFVKMSVIEGGVDVVDDGAEAVAPANGTTVITTSMRGNNRLVAYAPNGSVLYYDDSYLIYDDVDPSPLGKYTVSYVATEYMSRDECGSSETCTRNVIERVNLSTGERERIYSRVTASSQNHWHDADRLGPDRWLVADIAHDRAFIINTSTCIETWSWSAQAAYPLTSGGIFPGDWTHLNDVEYVEIDGRDVVTLSLRNQDSVAFVDVERGLMEEWTLGADGNHSILYEQHNPDFIPRERGGPALVVADSENNRIVEYQRVNGEWTRTWQWSDAELKWPRDADRLPNGNTLVTDTNGGRVIEVNERGEIVWEVHIEGPYEAERLGTGDESTGGPSATRAGLDSRSIGSAGEARNYPLWERVADDVVAAWAGLLPSAIVNPLLYVLPPWIGIVELGGGVLLLLTIVAWAAAEFHWSSYRLRLPVRNGR
jgi:hypothetical protein